MYPLENGADKTENNESLYLSFLSNNGKNN